MKDVLIKLFMRIHAFFLRISNGRLGYKLGTQTMLLLETIGRKTGRPRVIPIAYFFHDEKYLIVASNWGKDNHADWYKNLLKDPQAKLHIRGKTIPVAAYDTQGDEYDRLWDFAARQNPPYMQYKEMTSRRIPIVVFRPIDVMAKTT